MNIQDNGSALPLPSGEGWGEGYGLSFGRNPSPGATRRPLPLGEVRPHSWRSVFALNCCRFP